MNQYSTHIRSQLKQFVDKLKSQFEGRFDYIEGVDVETSYGLQHLTENSEHTIDKNPLRVSIGFSGMDHMEPNEVEQFHDQIVSFANREQIKVSQSVGDGSTVEYTFYLHSRFLDAPQ